MADHDRGAGDVEDRDRRRARPVGVDGVTGGGAEQRPERGYATTVHIAQGITADTMHGLATAEESRQQLYTMLTRGRIANHVYLQVVGDGDPHSLIRPETVHPLTATELLEPILPRDGTARSASTLQRDQRDPATRLGNAAARYVDALYRAAEDLAGSDVVEALEVAAEQLVPGLTGEPAWPTLRAHLLRHTAHGTDPAAHLAATARARELTPLMTVPPWWTGGSTTPDTANTGPGPLPWLPGIPTRLRDHPEWGAYLAARSDLVATLADQVGAGVADADTPEWATQRGSAVPTHVLREVQVWRAAMQVSPDDRRPTGPVQLHKAARTWQRHLDRQVAGDLPPALQEWGRLLDQVIPGVTKDAFTSALVDRLAAISRAGVDASQLLCSAASTGGPLPDDYVAAALWWRISRHLTPTVAANVDTDYTHATTWTPRLDELLGADRADALQSSRWWPPLITAVDQALQRGWRLDDLLGAADRPQDGFDDLGQALLWRIVLLTDPTPTDEPYEPFLDSAPPDKWPDTELGAGAISTAPDEIVRPEQRWAVLAGQLDERLLRQEDWPALAQLMQQVHEQGHDVAAVARSIVTTAPLNDLPAQDLRYRFVAQLHLGVDPHPNPVDTATAKTTTRPESRWKAFASSLAMTRRPLGDQPRPVTASNCRRHRMINTMTGSPEMQPLMTAGRTAGGHPGLSARRKNRPNRNRVERLPTRHLVERFYAQRHAHPSIGRCGPSFGTHGQDDCPRCPRHVAAAGQDHLGLITVMITD